MRKTSNTTATLQGKSFVSLALMFAVLACTFFWSNAAIAASIAPVAPCNASIVGGISFGGGWGGTLGGCKEDPIGALFRQAVGYITGTAGKALCTFAIILAGIGAAFGRITWIRAMVLGLGIAIIFGAGNVLHQATANSDQGKQATVEVGTCDDPTTLLGGAGLSIPGQGTLNLPLNHVCDLLKTIVNTIAGSTGQGIALIGVLILGLSALFGKLSPGQAVLTATGIALVYGAMNIVDLLWLNKSHSDCIFNALSAIGRPQMVLCRFLQELRGDSAKFLSTIAVMILGFMALLGRLQWTTAMICLAGIATVYGSDSIMRIIAPAATADCNKLGAAEFSASLGAIEGVLCNVVKMIGGEAGRALGSAAIVLLGFGAMLGKINFPAALIVCCGIAIAFGAPHFVFILTGQVDQCAFTASASINFSICDVMTQAFR